MELELTLKWMTYAICTVKSPSDYHDTCREAHQICTAVTWRVSLTHDNLLSPYSLAEKVLDNVIDRETSRLDWIQIRCMISRVIPRSRELRTIFS